MRFVKEKTVEIKANNIKGKIVSAGFDNESEFKVVFDKSEDILHILDDNKVNKSTLSSSLISIIDRTFVEDVLISMIINKKVKDIDCIIYQADMDNTDKIIAKFDNNKPLNKTPLKHMDKREILNKGHVPFYRELTLDYFDQP